MANRSQTEKSKVFKEVKDTIQNLILEEAEASPLNENDAVSTNQPVTTNFSPNYTQLISNFETAKPKSSEGGGGGLSRKRTMNSIFDTDIKADDDETSKNQTVTKLTPEEVLKQLRICEMNEFKTHVIYMHFLEFFVYHLFLFLILGPFTPILLIFQKGGMNLADNMALFPSKGFVWFAQMVFWFGTVIGYILYAVQLGIYGETCISIYEMEGLIASNIIRSIFVAAKYGSFSKEYIKLLRLHPMTFGTLSNRMLLVSWWKQNYSIMAEEFKHALRRNNIETTHFYFRFMRELPPERKQAIDDVMKSDCEKMRVPQLEYNHNEWRYPADYIGKDLIIQCNKQLLRGKMRSFFSFIVIIRTQVPNLIRQIDSSPGEHDSYFGNTWQEIVANIFMQIVYIMNMQIALAFLLSSLFDIQLRRKLMEQMSHMISPFKTNFLAANKIYPTLNFMDPLTLTCWYDLRNSLSNYGEGFFNRSAFTLTGFVIWLVLQITYIVCTYLEIFTWVSTRDKYILYGNAVFDTIPILITIMACIYHGALVNDHFLIHKKLMDDLKNIYIYLRINSHTLFHEKFYKTTKSVNQSANEKYEEDEMVSSFPAAARTVRAESVVLSENPLILWIQEYFSQEKYTREMIFARLRQLQSILENSKQSLNIQEEIFPQKIIGFKLTYELFWSIMTLFATIGILVFENSLSNNTNS